MTDETRILRTVGIPVVIAVILLVAMPKMCARAVVVAKARQEQAAPASGGLHIQSSQKPLTYPAGLDPERVRYLVEIDNGFAAPYTVRMLKASPIERSPVEQRVIPALQRLGFVELASDGSLTLTRDGLLHLDGLVDEGASWTLPLAKRQFQSVTSIDVDAGTARAFFTWQWQPSPVGAELMPSPGRHSAHADMSSATGRWTLTQVTDLDEDLQ